MKPLIRRVLTHRLQQILGVLLLVIVTSYCTPSENQTEIMELSPDETYLVDSYLAVREASDLYSVNVLISDSSFAALDSTIDTLRIANTIRELNSDPDRWVLVFRSIEEKRRSRKDADEESQGSEQRR
ncbi:MAG: hypothetical protein JSW50_10515 [Candidatus Latescibacterota bacterium]|nr:MAG: hypothetical protein JSW50_10515 [Candidatus Latescibacterota bacterium]